MKVAVAGAGITGMYLAWKLAEEGHKVVVFEKDVRVGNKACSALISERLNDFLPFDESLVENRIDFCFIRFPKKTVKLLFRPSHLAVDRQGLCESMLGLCRRAGAEVILGRSLREIPEGFDRIIACDGALSGIREGLGLSSPAMRLGLQIFEEKEDFSQYVETWPVKSARGNLWGRGLGFCWKIPRGGRVEYGALGPAETIRQDFDEFLRRQAVPSVPELESQIRSALVPQGLVASSSEKVCLCGDAAGLTKPWSGGGVIWGLEAAGILLKNFPDFSGYRKELKAVFQKRLLRGGIMTSLVYFLGRNLPFLLPSETAVDNDFLKKSKAL